MAPRHERRPPDSPATALAVLNTQALPLPAWALLFAGAAGTALVLAQALREVRTSEWGPVLGWGLGGSFAVGTGLWALQLALWRATQAPATAWFAAAPLVAAWALAVAGSGLVLVTARWLAPRRHANAVTAALVLIQLCLVFVVLGSAMAVPPRWQALAAWPASAALVTTALGVWCALRWLRVAPSTGSPWPGWPCLGGAMVFALAWQAGEWLALAAVLPPLPPLTAPAIGSLAGAMPPDAIDPRLVLLALGFGGLVLVVALVAAVIDSRSGRRVRKLASSLHDANQRLQLMTFQDALTGLPNRAYFEERLNHLLDDAGPTPSAMAVLFIDIDGFKPSTNRSATRPAIRCCRRSGSGCRHWRVRRTPRRASVATSSCCWCTPRRSHEAAAAVAQRTLHALVAPYALPNGGEVQSVVLDRHRAVPRARADRPSLIGNADAAMYRGQAHRRLDLSASSKPRMDLDARDQLALQTDLRQAHRAA